MTENTKTKTIYLFRHGETDLNKNGIIQGSEVDLPLNEKGRGQAEELAEKLKLAASDIEYIYSSPLNRAFNTAESVAKKFNINVEKIDNLKEMSCGKFSGLSFEKISEEFGEDFFTNNEKDEIIPEGGESKHMARDRVKKCIMDILASTRYSRIGIASHGVALEQFYYAINLKHPGHFRNCDVMKCVYKDGEIKGLEII